MSTFDLLLLAHLIGDFPFQTSWMAMNKAIRWVPLVVHSAVYTLTIGVISFFGFGGLEWWQLLIVFGGHVFLDRRVFVTWWGRQIMGTDLTKTPWLGIMVDQVFHVIILALIAQTS